LVSKLRTLLTAFLVAPDFSIRVSAGFAASVKLASNYLRSTLSALPLDHLLLQG